MEVIKYALIPMMWGVSTIWAFLALLSFVFKKIFKKDVKKTKKRLLVAMLCSIISLVAITMYSIPEDDVSDSSEPTGQYEENIENSDVTESTSGVIEMGETRDNPFVLTADELATEILNDIDAAKEKYNDKWVQITGTITDTSDGGIMYGYYLYGQNSTAGYTGLRIMCWCEDGPYSGSVIGDTQTFIGLLREVTTVNVTEIAECERISE